jgi:hypothetical protein
MSKYMQIDIRLIPIYEKSFVELFPGIANLLKEGGYQKHIDDDESLYLLVDCLVDLVNDPDVSPDIKKRIAPHVTKMSALKAMAREKLLSRKLDELDQYLYQIEDQFEDMEKKES